MSYIPYVYLLVPSLISSCLGTSFLATEQASQFLIPRSHANIPTGPQNQTFANATNRPFSHASTQISRSGFIQGYEDFCALWNSSCPGKTTDAFIKFEQDVHWQSGTLCNQQYDCTVNEQNVPPASKDDFADLVKFARSGKCASMFGPVVSGGIGQFLTQYAEMGPCCGPCHFVPTIIDLYYWPQPDADTSCLSLIGSSVNAPDYGATTLTDVYGPGATETSIVWNCVTASSLINGTTSFGYLETATLNSVGSITYKQFFDNPWWPPTLCLTTTDQVALSVPSKAGAKQVSVRAHPRALMIPRSVAQEGNTNSSGPLVVHQDDFAFTSPSLYVNFHHLQATDSCGPIGPSNGYTSTIVAFDPSELSTMLGGFYTIAGEVRRLNPADLPCPPRSVMIEAWYTPAPGQPYFPLIALPTKVQQLYSEWATCHDNFCPFTGFDPPRSLLPVSGMTPSTTTVDPGETPKQDPNDIHRPKGKITSSSSTPVPAATPRLWNPTRTIAPIMIPSFISSPDQSKEKSPSDTHNALGRKSSQDPVNLDPGQQASGGYDNDKDNHDNSNDISGGYGQRTANAKKAPGGSNTEHVSPQGGRNSPSAPNEGRPPIDPSAIVTTLPDGTNVEALPGGRYLYKGATLVPGAPPQSVFSGTVSLGISHELVISDHTYKLSPLPDIVKPSTTFFAGRTITFEPNAVIVAGTTLTQGSPAKYLSGTKIILGSTALTIGNQIVPIPSAFAHVPSGDVLSEHKPHAIGGVLVDGTALLSDGASTTIAGTLLAVDSTALVVGSMTLPFSSMSAMEKVQTFAGHTVDILPYNLVSDFASYGTPPDAYLSGLPSTSLAYEQNTLDFSDGRVPGSATTPGDARSTITLAGKRFTLLPGAIAIDGTTLTPGDSPNILSAITLFSTNYAGSTTTIAEESLTFVANGVVIDGKVIPWSVSSTSANDIPGTVDAAGQLGVSVSTEPGNALGSLIIDGFGRRSTNDQISPTATAHLNSTSNSTFKAPASPSRATKLDIATLILLKGFVLILICV